MITRALLLLLLPISASAIDLPQPFGGNPKEIQDIIGYKNEPIKGADLTLEQAEGRGAETREQSEIFSTAAMSKRATKMEEVGFTRGVDGNPVDNKGYLDKAKQTVRDAGKDFDFLRGGYTDCKPDQETTVKKTESECEEYYDIKPSSCFARQLVEIDPKYTYQCSKKRKVKEKTCEDVLTSLKCKSGTEGDLGGIVLSSIEGDMAWSYMYPILTLGNIEQRFSWPGYCTKYTRNIKFEIKDWDAIKEFSLYQVGYNRYIRISLNGTQVHNGPYGGRALSVVRGVVSNGDGSYYPCGPNTAESRMDVVAIDLKPYLKEGLNEFIMEVVVTGGLGGGWFTIKTKQHNCSEWVESREEKCTFF